MDTTIKYIFINKNNYATSDATNVAIQPVEVAGTTRKAIDRFRRVIGNHWFQKPKATSDGVQFIHTPNPPSSDAEFTSATWNLTDDREQTILKFQRDIELPFKLRLGKTYKFYTSKRIPASVRITPVTLVAKTEYFGPYPECKKCWYRYIFGEDYADHSKTYETIFGFDTLRLQEIESGFFGSRGQTYHRLPKTPLYALLLSDAGLPTAERLQQLSVEEIKLLGYNLKKKLEGRTKELSQLKVILFEDYYFESQIAKDGNLSEVRAGTQQGFPVATLDSEYNFYPPEYEEYVAINDITETKLANVYALAANKGTVPVVLKLRNEIECMDRKLKFFIQKSDITNLLVPGTTLPLVNRFYPFQAIMPYYTNIKFDLDKTKVVNSVIQEQRMDGALLRHISEIPPQDISNDYVSFKKVQGYFNKRGRKYNISVTAEEPFDNLNSWDYYEWIMKFYDNIRDLSFEQLPTGTAFVSPVANESVQNAIKTSNYYNKRLRLVALTNHVNQIIDTYTRNYTQLVSGEAPYKEIVAYKISKYAIQQATTNFVYDTTDLIEKGLDDFRSELGTPIQNYWFFNSTEEEVVNYVDSQILSNKDYVYIVYAYPLVLGNEYFYSNLGRIKLKKPTPPPPPDAPPRPPRPPQDTPCDEYGELPLLTISPTQNVSSLSSAPSPAQTSSSGPVVVSPTQGTLSTTNAALAYYDLLLLEYYRLLTQGLPYLEALKQSLQIVVPQITSALATSWGCVNGIVTCKATVSDKAITEVLEPKYGDIAKAYSESIRISEQITKVLFYSLDGTYMAKFGPQTVTMILALIRTFAVKGYLVFTNKCNCPEAFLPSEPVEPVEPTPIITGEEDPCTLIIQMSKTTDIFEFPTIAAGDIDRPLNDALMTKFGLNKDLNNLNEQDVEDARAKFVETMELLALKTGNPNLDPNTGEIAVTIDNYFDNLSSEGEFSLVDFMLFVAAVRIQSNFGTNNVITKNIPRGIFGNSATLELLLNVGVDYGTDALEAETSITYEEIVSECPDSMALEARVNSYIADQQEIKEGEFEISCDCIPGDVIEQKCKITMLATVLPKPVIFEVPYFIASAKVNNSLPIAPDVQFIPYKDVSDTILINLNTMEGQYRTKFVPILSSDYDYYNNLRTARSLDENELLEFSNDDDIRYYESFRIEYHPRGFEDFASSTYRKHKTNKRTKTDYLQSIVYEEIDDRIYSNSTSFDEVLLPNQKYYYLFRSVDKAGNISNPSRIFEVQLVSDSGATYPVIRTVEFITTDIMANSRDMKRFLILNPTFSHVSPLLFGEKKITEGATSAFDVLKDYQADTSIEHSLWDKRFKIRVTSLKSGRKLDININPVINIIDERTTCDTGPAQPTGLTSTRT